jgi:flagellar biosynthesis protein FlhA
MAEIAAGRVPSRVVRYARYGDVIATFSVVAIVIMFIIPIPPTVLDLLLVINLTGSLLIVFVTMYVTHALQFSVFPALLLVATLFRLGLSIAGTKLILTQGEAGTVINAFGSVVVGNNPVVGMIVFLIIVVIQFVVITNGAGRVAEVAARFTLDAMPGKQMAIDADLNAGLIDEETARRRRAEIEEEADFYGAMDGASKFVRGDAIAAIVIILINIIGGFIIGAWMHGMTLLESLNRYVLLTIGLGLVTQIPALFVSVGTGLIVTRAESPKHMGEDVIIQLLRRARPVMIASALLFALALVPKIPTVPFMAMGLLVAAMGYVLSRGETEDRLAVEREKEAAKRPTGATPEDVMALLRVDPIELGIGYGLMPLVDAAAGGDLLERIGMIRKQVATELGLVIPAVRVHDNLQLRPNQYEIKIRGQRVGIGDIMVNQLLAMDSGAASEKIEGMATTEPAFGLPATWINRAQRDRAEAVGYTVVEPSAVVATHLSEVIKTHAENILTRQDVQHLIDNLKPTDPAIVEDLIPGKMSVGEVQRALALLLHERVSIRDLGLILETLSDHADQTKDAETLAEFARARLARQITKQHEGTDGVLAVMTVDPALDQQLREVVTRTPTGAALAVDPDVARKIMDSVREGMGRLAEQGYAPVVMCSQTIRLGLLRLLEAAVPRIAVLSYNDVVPTANIRGLATVKIG